MNNKYYQRFIHSYGELYIFLTRINKMSNTSWTLRSLDLIFEEVCNEEEFDIITLPL